MNRFYFLIFSSFILFSCKQTSSSPEVVHTQYNKDLAKELNTMRETDQIVANVPQGPFKELSQDEWKAFQDSVFTTHQARMKEIFEEYGYPGYDLVGEEGEKSFFLMVQHSNHNPEFQKQVLKKMKIEVLNGNADPNHYGFLVDRVNINTGKPQVYGTQTSYRSDIGQAIPKPLVDSARVDERREEIGLPPLKEYLNQMTRLHFEVNKATFLARGIKEPVLYKVEVK